MSRLPAAAVLLLALLIAPAGPARGAEEPPLVETVLVELGSEMSYLANLGDPGFELEWVHGVFDDRDWPRGRYGVGFDLAAEGAHALLQTTVSSAAVSVFTRAVFDINDLGAVRNVYLGADYDDAYAAWVNGVEVFRSPELTSGPLDWAVRVTTAHESSNGETPDYDPIRDITAAALPALRQGENVLAVAIWNGPPPGGDLVLVPRLSVNRPATVVRGPYLQSGSHDGVVVRWRTDRPNLGAVRYGLQPDQLTQLAVAGSVTADHGVRLAGLAPATTYYYAVGSEAQPIQEASAARRFTTSPPPGSRDYKRVWVLGDSGTANAAARAVADAYREFSGGTPPDLWLMLGDNAYETGTDDEYQRAVFDMYPDILMASVLWPTLGNHDGQTADSASQTGPYYDIFSLPTQAEAGGLSSGTEAYYSFDYGNIHFVCLESFETDRSTAGPMLQWLEEDLASTDREWIIAFWHHPPYSKGSHDSDDEIALIEMRENALPILEAGGVDLVLTGHSHSYERSFLLDGHYGGSGTLEPGMVLDAGDGRPEGDGAYRKPPFGPAPHAGAVYVVAGSSGQLSSGDLDHPVMIVSLMTLGSVVLDVEGGRLDASFLSHTGSVRDRFTILKRPDGLPPTAVAAGGGVVECSSPGGGEVLLDATASSDPDGSIVRYEWIEDAGSPGERLLGTDAVLEATLPRGDHAITLRVEDDLGHTGQDEVLVTVRDTAPPELSVGVWPSLLWPPDRKLHQVAAFPQAADLCGAAILELVSIQHDEADSGGDVIGADPGENDSRFLLRATRSPRGDGRVYSILYKAVDESGNTATAGAQVLVPVKPPRSRPGSPGALLPQASSGACARRR
ncbi:MAG TPA: metallophosphoesterase [Candidatus Polarisedimenticolia bacterium]|nr:metallophosphoesterase [Candidatus Polarisedimenticolia bacterium]